jgi:hypothetical protein
MSDKPSVDELRARLRELGYLDAGVDRFLLRPVSVSRGLLSVAWRASGRIAALAALLLGPSLAAALGARLPGLVTGVRDSVVLALYLGILSGLAVGVAAFCAACALGFLAGRLGARARLAERTRLLSLAAGALVAGACLAYLVFWWRTVSPTSAATSGWTWLPLGLAAAISLLLGHAVRVTTLAVTAQGAGLAALPRRATRSTLLTLGAGVAAFAAAILLFVVLAPAGGGAPPPAPRIAAAPTGTRLLVVAIDGLDVSFLDRVGKAGRLPTLARLLSGARADLPASDAPDPARTWTSLATGQPAEVHGVSGIESRRVSGIQGTVPAGTSGLGATIGAATDVLRLTRPALTTSEQRRSKTFWEVASAAGVRTLVVNWWATWPVPDGVGTVISDRATLRLDRGGIQDAEIGPAALYERFKPRWPEWRTDGQRAILAAFPERDDPLQQVLRRAAEQDVLPTILAERAQDATEGLWAVYLPGLDIAQHELLGARTGLPTSALAARVEALERYYEFLDGIVGRLVAGVHTGDLVAIVGDPGRATSRGPALFALSGAPARAGARIEAGRLDVVPTLLYALGVPISRELPGRVRRDLFAESFSARVAVRHVETYGPRAVAARPPNASPLDREMLDRLRSLGYVR